MSIPSPPKAWASFQVGPFSIHMYALLMIVGIILAAWITAVRLGHRGVDRGFVIDVGLWAVPLGIIVARFYHVVTHVSFYFYPGANLWNVFAIWDGGNALYGSFLGGALGVFIACRRAGVRFFTFLDALAPGLLVAQSMGRVGNYFNHELFGLPTTLPWGLQIESTNPAFPPGLPAGTLFQPLFLYEIVWNLVGVAVILYLQRRFHLQWGKVIATYFMWYGVCRAVLESIRIDPSSNHILGIPFNEWASWVLIAVGIVLFVIQHRRHPGLEPSPYFREPVRPKVEEPVYVAIS